MGVLAMCWQGTHNFKFISVSQMPQANSASCVHSRPATSNSGSNFTLLRQPNEMWSAACLCSGRWAAICRAHSPGPLLGLINNIRMPGIGHSLCNLLSFCILPRDYCMRAHTHTHTLTHKHTHAGRHAHTYAHTHTSTSNHLYKHKVNTHTHTDVEAHTHTHTHKNAHKQMTKHNPYMFTTHFAVTCSIWFFITWQLWREMCTN